MTEKRFADELTSPTDMIPQPAAGFLLFPVAGGCASPVSPLQSLYQQIYQQAVQANQPPRFRDLFAIMN